MLVPLIQGAYEARSIIANAQRCINLYPERNTQDSPTPFSHYPTPGLTSTGFTGPAATRWEYTASNGNMYTVYGGSTGSSLYVSTPKTAGQGISTTTLVSTFDSVGTTPVSMADNGIVLIIVDGSNVGWALDLTTTGNFGQITDPTFIGANKVDYLDTFFIFNVPGTNEWYISLSEASYEMFTGTPGAILSGTITASGGGSITNGTYVSTALTGGTGSGAVATITVAGNNVTLVNITNEGINYIIGDVLSAALPGSSIATGAISNAGSSYTPGTYSAIALTSGSGSGATANIIVGSGGTVTSVTIVDPGVDYVGGDILNGVLPSGSGFAYTVYTTAGSGFSYSVDTISGQAFDPLDFASKTGYPDPIVTLIVMDLYIWLLGTQTTEIWFNAGAADFTFQIFPGVFIEHGCAALYSVAKQDLSIYWLSIDKQGQCIVLKGNNFAAHRISTFAIENEFASYSTIADAIGFTYQQSGHTYYVLTFPTADTTWVFDESTQLWHERNSLQEIQESSFFIDGNLHKVIYNSCAVCGGLVYVGDGLGNQWLLDTNNYTEDGQPIPRIRSFPHLLNNQKRVTYHQFIADMECGTYVSTDPINAPLPTNQQLESTLTSICLIPGAGEFVYATEIVYNTTSGNTPINLNNPDNEADVLLSLSQLQTRFPNLKSVTVVVGWFGLDLRCANCTIMPGVESLSRTTSPISWYSGGVQRANAHQISSYNGSLAYGGTPSDNSVLQLITQLQSMGYEVILYPFIFMDIPVGNSLPNPYGGTGQPAYPWRGQITCNPAIGQGGTPNKTSGVTTQVASFFGAAVPSNFSIVNGAIVYTGPNEWSFRKFILYYAKLAAQANVNGFIMGSELPGMTALRSSATDFSTVDSMVQLAADCRTIIGNTMTLTYAANWSEYNNYAANDGSNDLFFNLDPLWASPNISHIGIDFYPPLADWRNNDPTQLDEVAGFNGPYEISYIDYNIAGEEDFNWYYASDSDRTNQVRTTITDGAYNKPWVFRAKDLVSWWSNLHYNRPGGTQSVAPTSWAIQSKPIKFIEFGCGAINLGSNEPSAFSDPKSSESSAPYFSNGTRDDLNQRICLEALLLHFAKISNSPISSIYGGQMLSPGNMSAWCWDARPFPEFPNLTSVWSDGINYPVGQWIEGRSELDSLPSIDNPPVVNLRWSDNRGKSYGSYVQQSLGALGQYLTSMQWRRLGMARDRVFELSWSVPTKTTLNSAWIETQESLT